MTVNDNVVKKAGKRQSQRMHRQNQPVTGIAKGQGRWQLVADEEHVDDHTTVGDER